jgi:hypothetical protein
LALAICLKVFGPVGECFYQDFKAQHIAGMGHAEEESDQSSAQHRTWRVMVDMSPWVEKAEKKALTLTFSPEQSYKARVKAIEAAAEQPNRFASRYWLRMPDGKFEEWHYNRKNRYLLEAKQAILIFWYD